MRHRSLQRICPASPAFLLFLFFLFFLLFFSREIIERVVEDLAGILFPSSATNKWHYSPRKLFAPFSLFLSLSLFSSSFTRAKGNPFGFAATSGKPTKTTAGSPRAIAGKIGRDIVIDTLTLAKKYGYTFIA